MIPRLPRTYWLAPLCLVAFLLPLWLDAGPATAKDEKESPYLLRRKKGKCLCHTGQASWQYLKSPMRAPADPPRCGLIMAKGDCGSRPRPKGTSGACWGSQKDECFWKRHAYSWNIKCSECFAESECTACDEMIGKPDPKTKELLEKQLKIEGLSKKHRLFMAISPHFYIVTDLHKRVKVKTDGGAARLMSGHEFVHLFAERCERAYNDFGHHFGGRSNQNGKMGVYLMRKERVTKAYAKKYLGSENADVLRGGGDTRIGGGYCFNGFVGSYQEYGSDEDLHAYCRHMIGHVLFSTWLKVNGSEKFCPIWADAGTAHFLAKLLEPHKDFATFCSNETTAPQGPGSNWEKRARKLAYSKLSPIETFFGYTSAGKFKFQDHVRAWSIMDLGLREDNERWLEVLKHLRWGEDEGQAFKEGLGLTPDQFHLRWIDRLKGTRKSLGEVKQDSREDPEAPGRRERERVKTTDDPETLAGLIRGVHTAEDVKLLKVIMDRMDHESDHVREAIQVVLARTTKAELLDHLVAEGLTDRSKMVRAGVARVLGSVRYKPAREPLEAQLGDGYWLARANAAHALQLIADKASVPALVKALGEKHDKAWMAMADAVASFKERSKDATVATVPRIGHSAWQIRVTACQSLAAYGTSECMDALIKRFGLEKGRLEKEFRAALKSVANDDLGPKAATWAKWWKQQQEQFGGLDPNAPPKPSKEDEERYGKQDRPDDEAHYYGRRIFSKSVGFVFDTSSSMYKNITIAEGASAGLGKVPRSGTRMQVAKAVLAEAIRKLHPLTRFNLVLFDTTVRPWKRKMVQASPSNTKSAASMLMALPNKAPQGGGGRRPGAGRPAPKETNIHGALKAALGLHEKSSLHGQLDDIPNTIYFLTDGSPTRGEITATPELLGWFEDINRFGKVKLHVVAFGSLGVDIDFLERLAGVGGGDFIHVPEER